MKKISVLFVGLALLCFTQCHNKTNTNLVGVWQLQEMNVNGTILKGNALGDWLWEFNAAGGYLTDVAGMREKGVYTLKDSLLTLKITTIPNKTEQVYKVTRLDTVELDLLSSEKQSQSTLRFLKRKINEVVKEDKD